ERYRKPRYGICHRIVQLPGYSGSEHHFYCRPDFKKIKSIYICNIYKYYLYIGCAMIRELKTFIAVSREGTFANAAQKIGLTQAAVSAQMQRLEARLGFTLFDRQGRSATINAKGQQLLTQAQELIHLYSNLGAAPVANTEAMHINVGAIATMQRTLLPEALTDFHRHHTGCHTRIIPGVSMDMVNLVDAGDIDMAAIIRPPFQLQSELHWRTLAREPFRLIVPSHVTGDDWTLLL